MAAWWQSLSALDHVLLYIAVPATLILLIQTVLLFAGGAFDSDGDAGVPDADGPDFDGHDVDFDDMMNRLRRYTKEERQAMEHWEDGHDKGCRLQKAVDKKAGKVKTVKPAKAATGA